jgi:hypothetical protein
MAEQLSNRETQSRTTRLVGSEAIFRTIAEACLGLDAQLIISLGGGLDPVRLGKLAGDPVMVRLLRNSRH